MAEPCNRRQGPKVVVGINFCLSNIQHGTLRRPLSRKYNRRSFPAPQLLPFLPRFSQRMGIAFSKGTEDAPQSASTGSNSKSSTTQDERIAKLWSNAPLHLFGVEPGEPTFQRGLLWTLEEVGQSPTVQSTLNDKPFPRPHAREKRAEVQDTIKRYPHLFKIVTPINVPAFEKLLKTHPNKPFVRSIVVGLKEGFWPFANTNPKGASYPLTHDASKRPPRTKEIGQFLIDQCKTEIECERYSEPFGPELLPGMYSMPISGVPKQGPSKFRLIVDHSASDYSLNSMVSREQIAGARLDTIKDLADSLIEFRRIHGNVELVLFKCDVSSAYRRLPMHPLWQIKQIITVEGRRHVDRCNSFGNRGSQRLWVGFMALVIWIAIEVRKLEGLKLYIDDCFSFDLASSTAYYAPYKMKFPKKQANLLKLWDELALPHDQRKQVFGKTLVILGFNVDANRMTITLPPDKLNELLALIRDFCFPRSGWQKLQHCQQMAGTMNWVLNVFPLLKPGLRALHAAIASGSDQKPTAKIDVTPIIRFELSWFAGHAKRFGGIYIMESIAWKPTDAHHVFFCDAVQSTGLGCYFPEVSTGFQASSPAWAPKKKHGAYFLKALCVLWAIHIAQKRNLRGNILIFTDNLDTVKMFDSLYTPVAECNPILLAAVDILAKDKNKKKKEQRFAVQVVVVSGRKEYEIASALSRKDDRLEKKFPDIKVVDSEPLPTLPQPPQNAGWLPL